MIKNKNGFTLLEVLIALIIVSLVFFTCLLSLTEIIHNTQRLRDKTFASLVASNTITQIRLGMLTAPFPLQGSISMANQMWFWNAEKLSAQNLNVSELKVSVNNAQGELIYSMKGYMRAPEKP